MRTSVDVHNFLTDHDAPHEVFRAGGRFRRPERIAAVLDLSPAAVGKVVVFEPEGTSEGGSGPVAAVVPSDQEPDGALVSRAARRGPLQRADDRRAIELTEFLAETIPPAGLPAGFLVIFDRSFDRSEVLYFPGGDPKAILKIRGTDLVRATRAKVAKIAQER